MSSFLSPSPYDAFCFSSQNTITFCRWHLPQTIETCEAAPLRCVVNGDENWVTDLQKWLPNCLWPSSIRRDKVSIIFPSMLFIIVSGPAGEIACDASQGSILLGFFFFPEGDRAQWGNVENERKWGFNLPGTAWCDGSGERWQRSAVCVGCGENVYKERVMRE